MNAWSIYRSAVIFTAVFVLYTGLRPRFDPVAFLAGLVILACAFMRRPRPQ